MQILSEKAVSIPNQVKSGLSSAGLVFYHRTGSTNDSDKALDTVEKIVYSKTFIPGSGDMYGKGMYGTIDLVSAINNDNYGLGIIQYVSPWKGIIIFDYNVSAIVFGQSIDSSGFPAYSLAAQFIRYGIFTKQNLPTYIRVLSEDLDCSFGENNRRLSADRCYNLFVRPCINNDSVKSCVSKCHALDSDIEQAYISAAKTVPKGLYTNPKLRGIVFAGNHDGNVIVVYPQGIKETRAIQYAVFDPDAPCDIKKLCPSWTKVGTNLYAQENIQIELIKQMAKRGILNANRTLASIHVEDLTFGKIKDFVSNWPSELNYLKAPSSKYKDLQVVVSADGKRSVVLGGRWLGGVLPVSIGNFISGSKIHNEASSFATSYASGIEQNAVFEFGVFKGKHFGQSTEFKGGRFESGEFNGIWTGGTWVDSPMTVWGTQASFEKKNPSYIEVKGKISELDVNPEIWKSRTNTSQTTSKMGYNPKEDVGTNIERFIKLKGAVVTIGNKPWGVQNLEGDEILDYVKNHCAWLMKPLRFRGTLGISFKDGEVRLNDGTLISGDVYADSYDEDFVMEGGRVMGGLKPGFISGGFFEGSFKGGVFKKGVFNGKWYGGTWEVSKDAQWGGVAELIPGQTIGKGDDLAKTYILMNGRYYEVPEQGFLAWKTIPEIIDAIKSGDFLELMKTISAKGNKVKGASRIIKQTKTNDMTTDQLINVISQGDEIDDLDVSGAIEYLSQLSDSRKRIDSPLNEREYRFGDLHDDEQEMLYQEFKQTYEKTTGAAYSQNAFTWRADNWTFYGDAPNASNPSAPVGGIAVRKQMSNDMYRLVASFGGIRSVVRGFNEFMQKRGRSAIWGFVTEDIKRMLIRMSKDFVCLPGAVAKAMEPILKKISNGEVQSVSSTGELKVNTPSGIMTKVFVSNKQYIKWLIDMIQSPSNASKLPMSQSALEPLLPALEALL